MALQLHHCLRGRYCPTECRLEDLDLDALIVRRGGAVRLFHVS